MATAKEAQAVKSLNTTPGRRNRRFVYKSFAQRIEELEFDVYKSLEIVKAEPSSGSSFFLDCLIQWRELNTAEDFISLYEEFMPLVQTLPLILIHKDMIMSRLLSSLQMKARLSLEAILRLIAELSRDLQQDYLPFLPSIVESYLALLRDGADLEPEIIEQIFTSWSYIMMYLQRHLVTDVVYVLKVTTKLRHYPKDFVQEFMAKALSFLLRNAPAEQLEKGVKIILHEAVKSPSQEKISGVSALLWHIVRGTSSKFHSRADQVLCLLIDDSILSIGDKYNQGSDTVTAIVITAFERCMELNITELKLMWGCLCGKINDCLSGGYSQHLSHLLSVLISTISADHGRKVSDYQPMLELVGLLMQKFILPYDSGESNGFISEAADRTFQLMLCVLDGICSNNDLTVIPKIASQWAPVFQLRSLSLLTFLKELVLKDYAIVAFRSNILSGWLNVLEIAKREAIHLMMAYCEKLQVKTGSFNVLEGLSEVVVVKSRYFFQETICNSIEEFNSLTSKDVAITHVDENNLALLWGTICCIPYFFFAEGNKFLIDLVNVVDQLLIKTEADVVAGVSIQLWHGLIGAALHSYHNTGRPERSEIEHTSRILNLGKSYKSSQQILSAVADYLDSSYGSSLQTGNDVMITHPKLKAAEVMDAFNVFSENLYNPNKELRVSTLRILCHYEHVNHESQQMDAGMSEENHTSGQCYNVFKLLLSIEQTSISVVTSRKLTLLVSRIQTSLSAPGAIDVYVLPAFYGIIGLLHNQYMDLSNSALECLSAMINTYPGLLWNRFMNLFEQCQTSFLKTHGAGSSSSKSCSETTDLVDHFRSFCSTEDCDSSCSSILVLLLQALERIPTVPESHSRQIVPLFFRLLGYKDENSSLGSFDTQVCWRKDWKLVLMEWLNLFKLMKNSRSFYRSQILKEVLVNRLLDNNDAEIQTRVLDCLLNWKDSFLLPYEKHLKNLVSSKCLREELATWSLSEESKLVEEEHRAQLIPLVIRLLMPKVRSLRTLASRKHASVSNRKAVLGFIAQLSVTELPLFFQLLMKSLQITDLGYDGMECRPWVSEETNLDEVELSSLLNLFTMERILAIPLKKRFGFLHVVEEILKIFDASRVTPFLDLLLGCVVRVLKSCASSILNRNNEQPAQLANSSEISLPESGKEAVIQSRAVKQYKDMRSLCLKIISFVLNKYEDLDFGSTFWDIFFKAVKPLVHGFKQEGSSSEKPSSLFFCFLAMSQSPKLVSLLCREKNLIPDIFSILFVPTASEAIIYSVLKFIENLLTLEVELGIDGFAIKEVLLSNLDSLVDSLHYLFNSYTERKRKLLKHPGETVLRVLKLLSKFIKDQSAARKFVDILLLLASDGNKNSDVCMEALQILRVIVSVLPSECNSKILNAISPILISAQRDLRLPICDLLDALAENDLSLCSTAKLVCELNATSTMEMGDLDFDIIISAYDRITMDYFFGVREDQALVILSHCLYDIKSDELILRQSGYKSLLSFVEFSAMIIGEGVRTQAVPARIMAVDDSYWTDNHIERIVNKFLLKHMGDAMSKVTTMQKEWIGLLHEMVLKLSGIPNLGTLKVLCSEDAELDFFNNIVHLQKHRRVRALSRFRSIVATGQLSEFMLKKVFIPLFFSMLYDLQAGKWEHIRSACLDAIASISGQLGWKSYYALLMRCFRDMEKKPDREKVLLRLVCSILDQFHFSETTSSQDLGFPGNDVTENDPILKPNSVMQPECSISPTYSVIQASLTGTVLPKLQKLLLSDPDKVNVSTSVAILKVLKKLPDNTLDCHLSSIVHRISNFLKNHLHSIRDEARCALVACLKELGFEYLKFVVQVLSATLKRGYELHVLGYTLNFILSKGLPDSVAGVLDFCLDELLNAVDNDIFSEVAEQKEVEKVASKMKETRKQMSFNTLKLIAQNVTFKTHGLKLLSPVTAHMQKHLTPKVKVKLETMLTHIAEGMERNSSVKQTDLFIFIYGLLDDWLSDDNRKRETLPAEGSVKEKSYEENSKTVMKCYVKTETQCSYLIAAFALRLFHNRLRNIKLHSGNDELLSKLDPFIKLLTSCLRSKYEEILAVAIKCIFPLTKLSLPSLKSQADKIKVTLLDIAQSSSDVNSAVMQSCLKLLTALLQSTKITLSTDQLHVLIQFPLFVDLETNPSIVALTLLKAIVRRKLVVHELYDVVTQVAELMVTSQEEAIRKKCSQILLQFLLNYQLSQKRRQQHLDFLVAHLRYEHATGRVAVLEMLKTVIKRFPESIICEQSETFFLHLVLALSNDHDNQVRSLIGIVIKHLIGRINSQSLDSILNICLSWYLGEKQLLRSPAAQVLGFVVEVMKRGFQKHINDLLPVMKRIVQSTTDVLNHGQLNLSDPETIPFWKDAYYSFVLLEKILTQIPDLFFVRDIEEIWQAVSEFLVHPHPWICNISSRLVALYFEQMGKQGKKIGTTCLTSTSRMFLIASSLCCRLKVQQPDKSVRRLVKCNLAFAICGIQSLLRQAEFKDPSSFWSSLDQHEQGCLLKACQLLDPKSGRSITAFFTCGLDDGNLNQKNNSLSHVLVCGLLNTMGKTALQTEGTQTRMILGSLKLIAEQITQEDCQQFAYLLLFPIYKLCEGFAGKVVSDDVKQRAEKVRQKLQGILGTQNFVQTYNQIRHDLGEKRSKRKQDEKVMAVVNPVKNAKRKMRTSAKHQAHKKRKIMSVKMSRWMR